MAKNGKILLECPVSGTGARALKKGLVVFGSGDEAAFAKYADILNSISQVHRYLGPLMRDAHCTGATATIRMHRKDIAVINAFADDLKCALSVYGAAAQLYHAAASLGLDG